MTKTPADEDLALAGLARADEPHVTLTEFLLARIAEDHRRAVARIFPIKIGEMRPPPYFEGALVGEHGRVEMDEDLCQRICEAMFPSFIEVKDARLLAECEAKMVIVNRTADIEETNRGYTDDSSWKGWDGCHDNALRALALPYADHPDYLPEWNA